MTYRDGRVLTYDYGSANQTNDAASRVASFIDDDVSSTHLADYSYLGGASSSPTLQQAQVEGVVEVD
jgi:hypothetical protein